MRSLINIQGYAHVISGQLFSFLHKAWRWFVELKNNLGQSALLESDDCNRNHCILLIISSLEGSYVVYLFIRKAALLNSLMNDSIILPLSGYTLFPSQGSHYTTTSPLFTGIT